MDLKYIGPTLFGTENPFNIKKVEYKVNSNLMNKRERMNELELVFGQV